MRTHSKWASLILPLALYGVGMVCVFAYESDWTAKQTWAVVLTGVILIWYTWETMLLRQLATIQREAQMRPFVVFRSEGGNYVVENIGTAAALDVRLDATTIEAPGLKMDIVFPNPVSLLKAGSLAELGVEVKINGKVVDPVFAEHLDAQHAVLDIDVHIRFKNIEGKDYSLVETISPKTVTIKGFRNESAL